MVGCVGNAPTLVRLDVRFTGGSRSLRGYQPEMVAGRGIRGAVAPIPMVAERSLHRRRSVNRTTIGELMRLLWFCRSGGYAVCAPRLWNCAIARCVQPSRDLRWWTATALHRALQLRLLCS